MVLLACSVRIVTTKWRTHPYYIHVMCDTFSYVSSFLAVSNSTNVNFMRSSVRCSVISRHFFISTRKVLKPVQWNDVSSIVGSCILNRYFSFFGKSFIRCLLECILELFWCLNDFQSSYLIIANENHPENTAEERNAHTKTILPLG